MEYNTYIIRKKTVVGVCFKFEMFGVIPCRNRHIRDRCRAKTSVYFGLSLFTSIYDYEESSVTATWEVVIQ